MTTALLWAAIGAMLVASFSAIAAKVLREFSARELEEYCKRRRQQTLFDEILDRHDRIALGAESLQIVGTTILVAAAVMWLVLTGWPVEVVSVGKLLASVAVGALAVLVATSWIPAAVVRLWSAPFLYWTWRFWVAISWLAWPLTVGVSIFDALLSRLAGRHEEEADEEEQFEDEIMTMVTAGERDGLLEPDARDMIEGVIELGDTDVADIMTPRSEIDALEIDMPWSDVLRFVTQCGRTRIPVYEKTLDNIVGVLFVKELLGEFSHDARQSRRHLRELIRPPWFVPHTRRVHDLLQDFRRTRIHLAIVVDEYRGVMGIVTIEDVLEEIVGEIVDESDKDEEEGIRQIDHATAEVLGRTHLDDINERLGLQLPESDEFDTIAGLVVHHFGHIPKPGEWLEQDNVRISVLDASRRRVERLKIELLDQSNGEGKTMATGDGTS